ncbi:MAG: DUF192 domain-containing protein [Candidatus Harrisonbacteria bacterium]|nr:DUF192 domain-containing protein [Candidatus Harrisonbacteria bacterium]MBI2603965.1 DUF192 domain-containing protein [Candidatus Harrisonbacteria bacterium]
MKKQFAIFSLMGILLAAVAFVFSVFPKSREREASERITIGGAEFAVEVASTAYARMQGLSGRAALQEGHGMLFLFAPPERVGFWMKDMRFPIDMIWIAGNRVIGIEANASPDDSPSRTIYYPPQDVDAVLEVSAGSAARYGILIGSIVSRSVLE